jgi:hypothetical protein
VISRKISIQKLLRDAGGNNFNKLHNPRLLAASIFWLPSFL